MPNLAKLLIIFITTVVSCKSLPPTSKSLGTLPDMTDPGKPCYGCGPATLAQAHKIINASAKSFARRGYGAEHHCQDAAHYFVRRANQSKLRSRRLDIICGGAFNHAINLLLIKKEDKEWWCPVEPQLEQKNGPWSMSNIHDQACFANGSEPGKDFSIFICSTYVELVEDETLVTQDLNAQPIAATPRLLADVKGLKLKRGQPHYLLFPEGFNNPPDHNPLHHCGAADGKSSLAECLECCRTYEQTLPPDTKGVAAWKQRCTWHCEDYKSVPMPKSNNSLDIEP